MRKVWTIIGTCIAFFAACVQAQAQAQAQEFPIFESIPADEEPGAPKRDSGGWGSGYEAHNLGWFRDTDMLHLYSKGSGGNQCGYMDTQCMRGICRKKYGERATVGNGGCVKYPGGWQCFTVCHHWELVRVHPGDRDNVYPGADRDYPRSEIDYPRSERDYPRSDRGYPRSDRGYPRSDRGQGKIEINPKRSFRSSA